MCVLANLAKETEPTTSVDAKDRKRRNIDYHSSAPRNEKNDFGSNSRENDYSPDATEDDYQPQQQPAKKSNPVKITKRGLRGIAANRAAVTKQNWLVETQTPNASMRNKNKFYSRFRGRVRHRGRGRGARIEMLAEHRQFVTELQEQESEHESHITERQTQHEQIPKSAPLSDGKYSNDFIFHH